MPDDDANANLHSIDREPATGEASSRDTTEHADLSHRLAADSADERPVVTDIPVADRPDTSQPAATPASAVIEDLPHPGPGMMVLQWLVYALWGWTVLALSGLVILVVNQLLAKNDNGVSYWYGDGISYLLAAVIVLFIISLACDLFYARAERKHARTTGTNVIMIIHAVLFALFGIGALISSVFGGVRLLIGDTADTSGAVASILSGGIIFVLYGLTLLRTLRPRWIKGVVTVYWLLMATALVAGVVLGVMGPAAQARLRAQDAVIENALPSLAESINVHANETGTLPRGLNELTNLDQYGDGSDVKRLIDENLVQYKPGEKLPLATAQGMGTIKPGVDWQDGTVATIYHYQLCVDYKTAYGTSDSSSSYRQNKGQPYDTHISTYGHRAGNTCYDVQTDIGL